METSNSTIESKPPVVPSWQVITYKDDKFTPNSIRREDGEVFEIGDVVSNGTKMRGKILRFDLVLGNIYVLTDWSDVGMALEQIYHVQLLPSNCQLRQVVSYLLPGAYAVEQGDEKPYKIAATVTGVHFYEGKVKYDLELWLVRDRSTRIYNVDSAYVEEQ